MALKKIPSSDIEEAASEARNYVDNAAGEVAMQIFGFGGSNRKPDFSFCDDNAKKWYKKAKRFGVGDYAGAYADHIHSDEDWLVDMLGDQIHDQATTLCRKHGIDHKDHQKVMNLICQNIKEGHVHNPMKKAMDRLIRE